MAKRAKRGSGRTVDPIDLHVSRRISELRADAGMTLHKLAAVLGVTYQQVQKYEAGSNRLSRLSAARLYYIADALGCSIDAFFPNHLERELGARCRCADCLSNFSERRGLPKPQGTSK